MKVYIFLFLAAFVSLNALANERRALRLLEKRDFPKLIEVLEKDIEKDSINPGAYYIYSLLYNEPLFPDHDLDTSYHFILRSEAMYPVLDERDQQKLDKLGINDSTIHQQKQKLEHLAYQRALGKNTINGYEQYMEQFPSSAYFDEAIEHRNELAFEAVSRVNTYQAYYEFMNSYPGSRQYEEARKRYQQLLYEFHTGNEALGSYEDFIKAYPDSPYIEEAITAIYHIRTSNNEEETLLDFIRDFPGSHHVKDAMDRLYHNYLTEEGTGFTYEYNFLSLNDSLRKVSLYEHQLIVPVYEKGEYGFMTEAGEILIPPHLDDIESEYLCGNIEQNFLLVKEEGQRKIINKMGETIYDGSFYNVKDMGYGLLKFSDHARYGLLFKSGKIIFEARFDEILRLDNKLMKIRENDTWRLFSLNGELLLSDSFDEIEKEGEFLLFKKDGQWALSNTARIYEWYLSGTSALRFSYDDYVLIEPTQILCIRDDHETVIDKHLERKLPLEPQKIFALPEGWLVRKDSVYQLYDDAFYKISGAGFTEVEFKGDWISGKFEDKWILYHRFAPLPDVFAYDSINILNEQFVLVFQEEEPFLIFTNLKKEKLPDYERIRILKDQQEAETGSQVPEFLMVEFEKGQKSVFNPSGRRILNGDYESIQALGPEYLSIKRKGMVSLADTAGRTLLRPQFDGIANYQKGNVSVFKDRKFGLYNHRQSIYLEPEYDRIIKPYNDQFLIAYDELGYGIIDHEGNQKTDMVFEEISYWNDTAMLARESGYWTIFDIPSGEYVLEDIFRFEYLQDGEEKIILFRKEDHYGVLSNREGSLVNHSFNDIINLGSSGRPIYFAEKYIPEAEFYIVIYYNDQGEILRKQVFTEDEYDQIYCP